MNAVAQNENTATQTAPNPVSSTTNRPVAENNFVAPEVNIAESKDGYVLEAEMPGVGKDGLNVHLDGNVLTLEGRRTATGNSSHGELLYRESRGANYRRVFELNPEIDGERISARIEQGVLTVQLPKAEKVKPRRIEVN